MSALWLALVGCPAPDTGDTDTGDPLHTTLPDDAETLPGPVTAYEAANLRAEAVAEQPSVLRVAWTQTIGATVSVEFAFDGRTLRSPVRSLGPGSHEELLLGVPYDTDLTWHLVLDGPRGPATTPDLHARTGQLPFEVPDHQIQELDEARVDGTVTWFLVAIAQDPGFSELWWTTIMDREGRIVWARRSPRQRATFYPRIGVDGDRILLDLDSYWGTFDGGDASQIQALTIDGAEVQRWDTPGLHHSFTQMPDHTLLYGSYTGGPNRLDEDVMALAPDGTRTVLFDCGDWLDREGFEGQCGSNTVSYDPATDRVLVSWFTLDAVTELAWPTGTVTRLFGNLPGAFSFDPADAQFWYQHGVHRLPDGHLLLSTHAEHPHTSELVVREYVVDDQQHALRQVAVLGRGEGVPGEQMGEAHRLSNGNTLHNFGTNAHLREYTPDGDVVWEVDWQNGLEIGRTEPILVDLYELAPTRP